MKIITCTAPVNIAVIKYWGKRDDALILPINDSLSCTLSSENMCAKTTIMASPHFTENRFWLNGKEENFDNPRLKRCLSEVQKHADLTLGNMLKWNIHICSENNFPTAAGLASSAAGYACLVFSLAQLYNIQTDISAIARLGSGSACRSVYGGWVRWYKGEKDNGEDSIATQIAPASHWEDMRILVLVVNDSKKKVSSTSAMKLAVETSDLIKFRSDIIVPKRIQEITKAIKEKNFETFATITMKDSNQFHAICLDTYPPCTYMNDISHSIVDLVHQYNKFKGEVKLAYTFDAGPNACLYLQKDNVNEVISLINEVYPCDPTRSTEYIRGYSATPVSQGLRDNLKVQVQPPGCLKYIIYTKTGQGPEVLSNVSEHLLNDEGFPKKTL